MKLHAMEFEKMLETVWSTIDRFGKMGSKTGQPCRVKCHLVTVSQGRGDVTEGSRLRKAFASLRKCISRQYTGVQ
eukprot:137530-Pleurochrysis_carterae.AAC.1